MSLPNPAPRRLEHGRADDTGANLLGGGFLDFVCGWLNRGASKFPLALLAAVAGLALSGCGGGSSASQTTAQRPQVPDPAAIGQISSAFSGIALACLSPTVDETKLDNEVTTLIDSFKKYDDAQFSIGGPRLSMRSLLERSRDQLRNCAAAGRAPNASSLADMIDHELER
jgi:hypothetical protein